MLELDENRIYVGETTRLYRRMIQHGDPNVSSCNHVDNYPPESILAIYNVRKNHIYRQHSKILNGIKIDTENNYESLADIKSHLNKTFCDMIDMRQYALQIENDITLHIMKSIGNNWSLVRGGDFCQYRLNPNPSLSYIYNRPNCNCVNKMPAEINVDDGIMHFECARKSMQWIDIESRNGIDVHSYIACNYRLDITKDCNYYSNNYQIEPDEKAKQTFLYF